MASRSSPSTHSPKAALGTPSQRSRRELPSPASSATDRAQAAPRARGPAEKKHKNLQEVLTTGRQSDQGDRPGAGKRGSRAKK